MSLIRKPTSAEQASRFRQAAEDTLATGRALRDAGLETGTRVRRGAGSVATLWLLGMFSFGALTASETGAKIMGLCIMAPFWFIAWRRWNAAR